MTRRSHLDNKRPESSGARVINTHHPTANAAKDGETSLDPFAEFSARSVLKSDVFSTIERGSVATAEGTVAAVRRDTSVARWWAVPIATYLHWRERRALAKVKSIDGVSQLVAANRSILIRTWIDGVPLQLAKPHNNELFFKTAKQLLRQMHRAGVVHNDLAKEPNWLVMPDGRAAVTDFQLATLHPTRSGLYRLLAYEDLRHLLKHKRTYCPDKLTAKEKSILSRRSGLFKAGRAIKPVYAFVVHRIIGIRDREGGGLRYLEDAPFLQSALTSIPNVTGASVVSYHNKGEAVGLHAYVEAPRQSMNKKDVLSLLAPMLGTVAPPEHLTIVDKLPRDRDGEPLDQVLALIAAGQTDQIEQLLTGNPDAADAVAQIIAESEGAGSDGQER